MITNFLVFLAVSSLLLTLTSWIAKKKHIPFHKAQSLFFFGVVLSVPFVLVEFLAFHAKSYVVVAAFIAIELGVLYFEKHVKEFHDLVHHNVKHLRFATFLLIGIGFTYSELVATILMNTGDVMTLLATLPLKATFGIFIHTVLTSLASLVHVGALFAENIFETLLRFISYYGRILLLSFSHYLYVFFNEHSFSLYVLPFLVFNLVFFFWAKAYLDKRRGILPE